MGATLALIRAGWLTATSYRVAMLLSLVWLPVTLVPVFLVARALNPVLADSIATQGDEYFPFLLVGMIAFSFLTVAVNALPGAVSSGLSNGTLEAMLATPAPTRALLAGFVGYRFLWTAFRALLLVGFGWALGAHFAWDRWLLGGAILLLIVLAYLPFGLLGAAFVLAFRTSGPLAQVVLVLSGLLGGVYYPTQVIPSWIQDVSALMPLTYGLRALRQVVLEGLGLGAVAGDLAILAGFVCVLFALTAYAFALALRYARRSGTLAQY